MKADIKTQIQSDIRLVTPFDTQEKDHIADAIAWIHSAPNIFRIEKPDKPPKHLVAYFVLIDPEHRSLLLGDHIKAQLWLPSGGHVELNEHPKTTVMRECQEELHQKAVFLKNNDRPFFVTVTNTVGLTAGHTDVSLWYLLRGSIHDQLNYDRTEFTDMNWFTFDEIIGSHPAIFDPHLQRFMRKLTQYLGKHT
jgi:8-oxo-dGTP pyrophosphatase MutT (NUDIX family)